MAIKISALLQQQGAVRKCYQRPHDVLYDPNFVLSSETDFNQVVTSSAETEAEIMVCPLYNTMFSDAYPRSVLKLTRLNRLPPWVEKTWKGRQCALARAQEQKKILRGGTDKFFRRPVVPFMQAAGTGVQFSVMDVDESQGHMTPETGVKNRSTQTDYRESETQTSPWAPPVKSRCTSPPEILTLARFSWEHGLPAGMHEVEIIERARKRRAWEKIMPTSGEPKCIELMRHMIDTVERDEWVFREAEIETINQLRIELAKKLLKEFQQQESDKLNDRIQRYWLSKQEEKKKKIQKIRSNCSRELRKLALRHKGVSMKYHEVNIVDEHIDHRSELYGPQMRFGEHPKRRHEVINVRSRFLTHIKGLEILETMPKLSQEPLEHLTNAPKRSGYELCIRETRWTEDVLRQLHEDLRDFRTRKFEEDGPIHLITRLPQPATESLTPGTEGVTDREEEMYQSAIFIQKILKGRAVQTLMCKGRRKYQELIEELKSTTALQQADMVQIKQHREHEEYLQREEAIQQRQESRMKEIMEYLEGQTISSMLDFLSKELWRLQDDRRIHAFALLAERERYKREAAEAGRRQTEERRRREHDEIFKQLVKVHQDTVDMYLEDLVMESMEWTAEAEARHHVRCLARKIDKAAEEVTLRQNDLEQEELVADLIHNFVVPEVQKKIIREQMKKRQAKYLQEAHATIYDEVENLPPILHHEERKVDSVISGMEEEKLSEHDVAKPVLSEEIPVEKFASFGFARQLLPGQEKEQPEMLPFIPSAEPSFNMFLDESQTTIESEEGSIISEAGTDQSVEEEEEPDELLVPEELSELPKEKESDEEESLKGFIKPKITLTDKEFQKGSQVTKTRNKIGFSESIEAISDDESTGKSQKTKQKIGFKEPESIPEEGTKQHKTKQKIGFQIDFEEEGK